jgi:CrcB protein
MAAITPYLLIALGGAIGSVARALLNLVVTTRAGELFPWGILAVNVLGCLAIGALSALIERESLRVLLMTGLCGGFTTFSAFSLDALRLLQAGRPGTAAIYVATSLVLCLLGTWLGWTLAQLGR